MNNKRYIGIDLGGTKIAAGLVDDEGKILKKLMQLIVSFLLQHQQRKLHN